MLGFPTVISNFHLTTLQLVLYCVITFLRVILIFAYRVGFGNELHPYPSVPEDVREPHFRSMFVVSYSPLFLDSTGLRISTKS